MEKREKSKYLLASIFFIFILSTIFYFVFYNSVKDNSNDSNELKAIEVIDGDTFILSNNQYARLIGVNAPEKDELNYNKSKEFLESKIINQTIRLEYDLDKRDNYGRLLVYVFVNETFINKLLVKEGYAVPMTIKPNTKYKEEIESLYKDLNNV